MVSRYLSRFLSSKFKLTKIVQNQIHKLGGVRGGSISLTLIRQSFSATGLDIPAKEIEKVQVKSTSQN